VKRETKIYNREPQEQSEGGIWELCVFAIFFVVVFTVLARTAHAEPLTKVKPASKTAQLAKKRAAVASNDPNLSQTTSANSESAEAKAPVNQALTPVHLQTMPSAIPSGAVSPANISATLPEKETSKRVVWSSSLTIDTSGTLNADDARSYSGEYLLKTGLSDKKTGIAGLLKLGYDREYSFEQDDGHDGDLVDPSVAVTKTWTEGKDFRSPVFDTIVAGVSGVAGASRESARRTLVAAVGPKLGVTKKIHRLNLGETFGYSRRFYNYDIRDDGTVNSPDSFSSTTDISFDITDDLSIAAETALFYAINFQGTGVTEEWSSLELDYTLSKTIGTALGVATKRGTISDDGTYNQIKFIDANVAQAYFDLILNF